MWHLGRNEAMGQIEAELSREEALEAEVAPFSPCWSRRASSRTAHRPVS